MGSTRRRRRRQRQYGDPPSRKFSLVDVLRSRFDLPLMAHRPVGSPLWIHLRADNVPRLYYDRRTRAQRDSLVSRLWERPRRVARCSGQSHRCTGLEDDRQCLHPWIGAARARVLPGLGFCDMIIGCILHTCNLGTACHFSPSRLASFISERIRRLRLAVRAERAPHPGGETPRRTAILACR